MKREEAIIRFERQLKAAQVVLDSGFGSNPGESDRLYRERKEMAEIAIAALRGPTREQVEKYFGAVWEFDDEDMEYDWSCSKCAEMLNYRENFCSRCGSAMTDKAVDIVMKRLEGLHENDR